jgi:diacylglycerol kinase family enzyme
MSTEKLPPHLSPERDIHVVVSTASGLRGAEAYYTSTLQPLLSARAITHKLHLTTSTSSIISLCSDIILPAATQGIKQTILLLSGDGGIVDIVNTLSTLLMRDTYDTRIGTIFVKPVLVLFPLGTANALAWSSGAAADPISTLLTGVARPLPQFSATFSPGSKLVTNEGASRTDLGTSHDGDAAELYGAVVFSWGLHASLVSMSDTSEYRKFGSERFKMAAQKLLVEGHAYRGRVQIRAERDGEWEALVYPSPSSSSSDSATDTSAAEENTHAYILCPLVSHLEQTFHISPSSPPLSPTLRLLAISPTSTSAEITRILTLAYQSSGPHIAEPSVTYKPIDGLRIEFLEEDEDGRWRQVCVDGKIVEVPRGGWAEVAMLPGMGMDGRRVVEVVVPR